MGQIVDLTLEVPSGSVGRVTSVGHVFARGDIPEGQSLLATASGDSVALQVDVKATWDDGSIKHAVLSFAAPPADADGTAALSLSTAAQQSSAPPLSVIQVAATAGYDFEIEIDGEVVQVANLLATQPVDQWLNGLLASQTRVTKTLANGLELRIDVTVKLDGVIDTSVTVGNDNVETVGLDSLTYAYAIRQNGVEVLANPALIQPHHTVWRETFSTEATSNQTHAIYDVDYLRETGLLPSIDDTLALTDAHIYGERLTDPNATYDPLELGGIDNIGGIDDDRGRTGTTPSYGLLTDDQHSYIVSQTREARDGMLALTDQYGAFSNSYRNPETGEAYFLEDVNFNSATTGTGKDVAGTGGIVDLVNDGLANRNSVSHKPSEYYLSYLVTGDRYYADGLAGEVGSLLLWANASYLTERGAVDFGSQLREQTAVLRDLFYAASLAPDGTHAANVLNARLDGALEDYLDYYVRRDGPLNDQLGNPMIGDRTGPHFVDGAFEGVLQSYGGTAVDRPYWQDWFGMVIGQIAATGDARAQELGQWMAGFSAERFLQDDFDPTHNLYSIVAYPSGSSLDLEHDASWADLNAAGAAAGALNFANWSGGGFYAASAWGGTAAMFSGVRDARYAEALLWMAQEITEGYVTEFMLRGPTSQFSIPITFANGTTIGVVDRTAGTGANEVLTDGSGSRIIHAGGGNDDVLTGSGSHLVDGGDGNDSLIGSDGEDWLFGGSGNDLLSGGGGINYLQGDRHDPDFGRFADTFSFRQSLGQTTIGDFTAGQDTLALNGFSGLASAADVLAQFEQGVQGATLDLGTDGRLMLNGVDVTALSATDIVLSTGTNFAPIASNDDGFVVESGKELTVDVSTLIDNDIDADGDSLTLDQVSSASGGTVALHADGTVHFTASQGAIGAGGFSYRIHDGLGGHDTAQVSITIVDPAPPRAPRAAAASSGPVKLQGPGWLHGTAGRDLIIPTGTNVRVFGKDGEDIIHLHGAATSADGGAGWDVFYLYSEGHAVWGGDGKDAFSFSGPGLGATIHDFSVGEDTLYFANRIGGLDSDAAVQAALIDTAEGAVIDTDAGRVVLTGVTVADLTPESFGFYNKIVDRADTLIIPNTGPVITGSGWLSGTDENDAILSDGGNIRVSGGFGDDHLTAAHWNVHLYGGAGNDVLEARDWQAQMYGESGADIFYFAVRADGRIADFQPGMDRVVLNAAAVGGLTADEVFGQLTDSAEGAVFDSAGEAVLVIAGLSISDLSVDDFLIL